MKHPSATKSLNDGRARGIRPESGCDLLRTLNALIQAIVYGDEHRLIDAKIVLKEPKQSTRAELISCNHDLTGRGAKQCRHETRTKAIGKSDAQRRPQDRRRGPKAVLRQHGTSVPKVCADELPLRAPFATFAQPLATAPVTNVAQGAELTLELAHVTVPCGSNEQQAAERESGDPSACPEALSLGRLEEPPSHLRRKIDDAV